MKPTILIVDDEPMLLELFQEALSADYEVMVTKSIDHAIAWLQVQAADAVVTDLNCGEDGNGLDLLRWVQAHRPGLLHSSFILSGADDPDTEGIEVPVICKPVDLGRLRNTFACLLGMPGHLGESI